MRPLSLTLEGFTCFKQRQTVSFDGVDLFAIWGPTGAGKSSLLDAMVFALFGKIPRLDEKRNRDVISLTRDKAVVLFEFSAGLHKYRVVRTAKRKGAPDAKLEDGDGNLIAEGVRGVEAAILRCLGLSYDAFIQSVMLPQGEFARFLKSPPGERRVILRDLLRLDVYERMRTAADQRRRELDGRLSGLERVLSEYVDATSERLDDLGRELEAAKRHQKTKQDDLKGLSARLEEIRTLRKKTEELEQVRCHIAELHTQEPKVRATRARIDASERASAAMPEIVRAEQAQAAEARERAAAGKAREAVEKEQERYARAESAANRANEETKQIAPLRDRIRALDGIRGVFEAKRGALGRLENAKRDVHAAESRVRAADAELGTLRAELRSHEREVGKAAERLAPITYDRELDTLLQRVARDAMQLGEERKQAIAAGVEVARAEADTSDARAGLDKKARALEQARLKHHKAAGALERAEQARRDAHEGHAAVVLRRALRRGEPCPVCAQQVDRIPKPVPAPALRSIEEHYEQAKRAEAEAAELEKRLATEHAGLEAIAAALGKTSISAKRTFEKASDQVAKLEGHLSRLVGKQFDREPGATIEERVLVAADRLVGVRAEYAKRTESLAKLQRDRDLASKSVESKESERKQRQEATDLAKRQVAQTLAEVNELDAKIKAVTMHPDPSAESTELDRKVREIEGRVETARAAFAEAQAKLATAKGVAAGAAEKAVSAEADAAGLRRLAETALKEAGLASMQSAKAAVIEPAELARLRQAVEDYRVDYETTGRRISVLEGDLGRGEVSQAQLDEANQNFEKARQGHETAIGAAARLDEQIGRTRDRLEKRKQFEVEQDRLKVEYRIYRQLAEELRTDRFQEFVLEEVFHDLARGASERLKELTGRYALEYEEGDILVVDHDNADETRSADTLSGGETFLASLSLALELSEQIQQAAGAVLLESLFIDEGFGTLDLETLDSAASAIECLRGGGRMVGIITHIRDLADRLPYRIEVDWRSEGSQVEVHQS